MNETIDKTSTAGQATDKQASNTQASDKIPGYPGHADSQSTAAPAPTGQDKPSSHGSLDQTGGYQPAYGEDKPAGHDEGAGQAKTHAAAPTEHAGGHESTTEQAKCAWKEHIAKAKQTWSQLNEEELLQTEGDLQKLTTIVQRRYGITHEAAEKQVKALIDQCL